MICVAALMCRALIPGAAVAQNAPPRLAEHQLREDAMALLQGADTAAFLDPDRITTVMRALRAIRSRIPQVAHINIDQESQQLTLLPHDSIGDAFITRSGTRLPIGADTGYRTPVPTATGIKAIDSLNAVFGVSRVDLEYGFGVSQFVLTFRRPPNLPVIAAAYQKVPQLGYAGPGIRAGIGVSNAEMFWKRSRMHFVFYEGEGRVDYYFVTFDTLTRIAHLEAQGLDVDGALTDSVDLWDVRTRQTFLLSSAAGLFAQMRDARWWHRQHALNELALALSDREKPYDGLDDAAIIAHFAELKRQVAERRHDAYTALVERLDDEDVDVAALAHRVLLTSTGMQYANDAAGKREWRAWLLRTR